MEDNAALGCEEVIRTVSRYSQDRLKETLIDPENRDACGRNITDPGTDVEQSSRNAVVAKVGRLGEITDLLNAVVPFLVRSNVTRPGANQWRGRWVQLASGENASIW